MVSGSAPYRDDVDMNRLNVGAMPSAQSSMESLQYKRTSLPQTDGRGVYLTPMAAVSAVSSVSPGTGSGRHSALAEAQHSSSWLDKQQRGRKRQGVLFYSACGVIIILVGVGIALGVVFGTKNGTSIMSTGREKGLSTNGAGTSSGGGGGPAAPAGVVQQNGNDPSQFTKDSRLKPSFYGFAYTPQGGIYPDCAPSLPAIIEDIQLLSQLTTRIRLYGADCNQTAMVLEAVKQTKVPMQVYPAIFVVEGDDTAYTRQKTALFSALNTYGFDLVAGITVGNEFMLNYCLEHKCTTPDDRIGQAGSAILNAKIADVKTTLTSLGGKAAKLPVGTADAGAFFSTAVLDQVEYGMSNIHAWFADGITAETAGTWTLGFFQDTNVGPAVLLPNKPQMYIAETGWPTNSSDVQNSKNAAGSEASVVHLQLFLDTFICAANSQGTKYFFFEFFDEPWKEKAFGGVEPWWGLFTYDKKLKNLTLPDCTPPA